MATRDDLRRLRVPLVVAAVLLAVGAAAVFGMQKWAAQARGEQQGSQAALNEARGKLARAREEEAEIKRSLQQYRTLAATGVIGEENRLDWIERINSIRLARKLFDVRADISEQKRYDTPASGPDIMVSRMELSLPLLHEGDLFTMLSDLRASGKGYFQVKSCTITRGALIDRRTLAPTMDAVCQLDFYTIRERAVAKVAGS